MAEKSLTAFIQSLPRKSVWQMAIAIVGLAAVYVFQNFDILNVCSGCSFHPYTHFVVRKIFRVLLNDTFMLLFIHALFRDQSVTRLAFYIQLVDTLLLLPIYLVIKLTYEGDAELSMPLLSQLHRLIVNPTLMVLLIPAVYYQRKNK